ncbi:MAG TPA: GAF domain-containing protein, partial [Vicinamibacterales bacterium]|nr:GAF domain-containing protein [Vicinamibacterales bacterium]
MIGAWRDSGVWRWMRRRGDAGDGRAAFLARASQALASSLDYETTLATMAKLAIPGFADWSAVHLGDATHVQRVAVAHRDPALEGVLRSWQRSRPFRTDVARGVPEVIRTGRPLFLPIVEPAALREIASLPGAVEMFTRVGCASLIIVPLDVDGRTLGTLMFVRGAARRPFAQADLTLAETLGRQAALAVDHAVLYAALARRERLYHLTFEQAPVGIAHVALDGRLLDVNDRLALLLGRPRAALLALQASSLRHPDDQGRDEGARERLLEGKRDRV